MRIMLVLLLTAATSRASVSPFDDFSEDCQDCWPGWTVVQDPASGRQISVSNGAGHISIFIASADEDTNFQHMVKDGTEGTSAARAVMAFTGSQKKERWSRALSAPPWGGCYWSIPPIVADAAALLKVYDNGPDWIGAGPGMPAALDIQMRDYVSLPPEEFTALILMQSIGGVKHELDMVILKPPIPMFARIDWHVAVVGDKACAGIKGRPDSERCASLLESPASGQIGFGARTQQAASCNGGVPRDFAVYRVEGI